MSNNEVVSSVSKTSVHEDIIREAEETDWSVDPIEVDDGHMCKAPAEALEVDISNNGLEGELDDIDFDPDELECVDEDAEEERRDREVIADQRRGESHKYARSYRRSSHDKHRHHPYSRKDREYRCDFRTSNIQRRHSRIDDSSRMHSKQRSSYEFRRSVDHRRARSPSRDRAHRNKRECDDKDVPLEELELEEVDCYDEIGDDDPKFSHSASGVGESRSGDDGDHHDDKLCSRVCGMSNVDDDFPDLCEDIDVDAMRRAAAATNAVLSAGECDSPDTSLSSRKNVTTYDTIVRNESGTRKIGIATFRGNRSTVINGRQEDEARRRQLHYVSRNDHSRSIQSEGRYYESRGKYGFHEKRDWLGDIRHSSSVQGCLSESIARCNTEGVSVKGPFSCDRCPVDNEEQEKGIPIDRTKIYLKNDEIHTDGCLLKRRFSCDTENSRHGQTTAIKSSSADLPPVKERESLAAIESSRKNRQAKKEFKDHSLIIEETVASPKSTNHHCLQQKSGTAVVVTEKIPSLLDMCIKGPKQPQTSQATSLSDGISTRISFPTMHGASQRQGYVEDRIECISKFPRSRSLLSLDIPPPDHKTMRQYAISLNNRELMKRSIEERTGKKLLSTRCERSRQPRSYVHRVHRVQ